MTDPDYNTNLTEEEYFERSGCGCIMVAAIVAIVALLVGFIILCSI